MRRPDPIPDQHQPGQRPSLSLLPVSEAPQAPVGAPRFVPPPEKDESAGPTVIPPSTKKKQARSSSAAVGAPAAKRKRLPDNEKDYDKDTLLKDKNKTELGMEGDASSVVGLRRHSLAV